MFLFAIRVDFMSFLLNNFCSLALNLLKYVILFPKSFF